jgi:putative tryptophan/tyrosine transport system substrate-binding protein
LAANHATTSIPIVMLNVPDPIGEGIVVNFAHPEANVTGLADSASAEISGKRLQILKDAVPGAVRVAVITSPNSSQAEGRFLELAAQSLHIELSLVSMHQADDIPKTFDELSRTRPDAMLVPNSSLIIIQRKPIVEHAVDSRIPAIFGFREAAELGSLLSYGADRVDAYRRAADFAAKILKGTKPGDLPVEQPTKYELVINLKTAKAINLEVPRSLLLIADEVIE